MKKQLIALMAAACIAMSLLVCPLEAGAVSSPSPAGVSLFEENGSLIEVPIVILNSTGVDIYRLYMSDSNQSSWGDDVLGRYILEAGQYLETTILVDRSSTDWDFKIEDSEGNEITWYNIDIGEMSSGGFGIEFLWDGSDGYINLVEDSSDLRGTY